MHHTIKIMISATIIKVAMMKNTIVSNKIVRSVFNKVGLSIIGISCRHSRRARRRITTTTVGIVLIISIIILMMITT